MQSTWCWALGEGALVPRSMELPALHTQLLTGCLARCHGRGHTGYYHLTHVLSKEVPRGTEGEDVAPFQFN